METKELNEYEKTQQPRFWNVEGDSVVCLVLSDGTCRYVSVRDVADRCELHKTKRAAYTKSARPSEGG